MIDNNDSKPSWFPSHLQPAEWPLEATRWQGSGAQEETSEADELSHSWWVSGWSRDAPSWNDKAWELILLKILPDESREWRTEIACLPETPRET